MTSHPAEGPPRRWVAVGSWLLRLVVILAVIVVIDLVVDRL